MTEWEYWSLRKNDPIWSALSASAKTEDRLSFMSDRECTWCGTPKIIHPKTGLITCQNCSKSERSLKLKGAKDLKKKEQEAESRVAEIQAPQLDFLEAAKIAKQVAPDFPISELDELIDFLDGDSEIRHTISLLHDTIKPRYRDLILANYKQKEITTLEAIDADIKQAMDRGMKGILKNKKVSALLSDKDFTASGKIEKKHSWEELKDKF